MWVQISLRLTHTIRSGIKRFTFGNGESHTLSETEGEILPNARSKCVDFMVQGAASEVLLVDVSLSSRATIAASFICQ